MSRVERITESTAVALTLSDAEARMLSRIGSRLASDRTWWGAEARVEAERSVIRCTPLAEGTWSVRVQDAVGLIAVDDLQIVVAPKIPVDHLLFLFAHGLQVPRLEDQPGAAASADALWELVARWFVRAAQAVLRRDLSRGYVTVPAALPSVRGRLEHMPTARAYYAGRLELHCTFDDFVVDTPLNRMIKAAAREVSRSSQLTKAIRKDALRIAARMEDVGELRVSDHLAVVDRPTSYYRDALTLARHILRFVGRTLAPGELAAWTFLIRTPELVEEGIRQILQAQLVPEAVTKKRKRLPNSTMTFNPDIVFGDERALADVKYKLMDDSWNRADLYEAVAFATAFRVQHAALIGFGATPAQRIALEIGDCRIGKFLWPCESTPELAASRLSAAVKSWLALPN